MKIVRGLGIFLCVLVIAFIVLFNINNVMYRTSNEHINIFGYKLMTIDNKYDYYLVKDVNINDVILYDNVSFRINSTDLSTDSVKGRVNDCLKLAKSSTVVCSENLEGKVVMKVNGARDFLFANKGSIIALVACIILLILVFLWKPDKKKEKVPAKLKEAVEKPTAPEKVATVEAPQTPATVEAPAAPTEPFQPAQFEPAEVTIAETPVKEEIKQDVELPVEAEVKNDTVVEVDKFNVNNNLENQNFVSPPMSIGGQPVVDIPLDVDQFEVKTDTPTVENVDVNQFEVNEERNEPDVVVAPYTAPSNEDMEEVIVVPLKRETVDDSLNDVISIPYDKVMEFRQKEKEQEEVIRVPISKIDYDEEEVIRVPLTYSSDRYDEFEEVIRVPITKVTNTDDYADVIRVPLVKKEDSYFDTAIENDIFGDANINTSVEINLDDVEVEEHSNKVKVTPIYSKSADYDDEVEIL